MRLRSRQRLRRQSDFAAVRQQGRRQFGAAFVVAVRRRPPDRRFDLPRFAVVASRRVGNAVMRNLLKRRMREIFRAHQTLFPRDIDVIVTLQPKGAGATYAELEKQFLSAARRFGFPTEPLEPPLQAVTEIQRPWTWRRIPALVALGLLRLYQRAISPFLHAISGPAAGCRFAPTCSEYARQAIHEHGLRRGGWLAVRRILKCHPWNPGGHDPVPPRRERNPGS